MLEEIIIVQNETQLVKKLFI